MSFGLVQGTYSPSATGATGTALSVTLTHSITSSNAVIATVADGSSGTTAFTGLTDDKGNVYTITKRFADSGGNCITTLYAAGVTNSPSTFTAHWSSAQGFLRMLVEEWQGIATISPLDGALSLNSQTVTGSTSNSLTSGTTTGVVTNGDMFWAVTLNGNGDGATTITPGTSPIVWTAGSTDPPASIQQMSTEYFVQSTAANIAATFTINTTAEPFTSIVMAFKAGISAVANIGKTAPILFRPHQGPSRGFYPKYAYPTSAPPPVTAISLLGQSSINVKGLSSLLGSTALKTLADINVSARAAPMVTAPLTALLGRAKGPAITARAGSSITASLLGRVASQIRSRIAKANTSAGSGAQLYQGFYSTGNSAASTGELGNNYVFTLTSPSGAGNCLVLKLSYPIANTISSISDTVNGSWSTTPAVSVTGGALKTDIYTFLNIGSGVTTTTIKLNASTTPVIWTMQEWTGIATSGAVNGTAGAASQTFGGSTPIATGAFTPGNNDASGGNVILAFFDLDASSASGAPTSFASGSGFTLMHQDIAWTAQGLPKASEYFIQTTHASINPGISPVGDTSDAFNCVAVALKINASAGTPQSSAIRLVGFTEQFTISQPANWTVGFPTTGNLRVIQTTSQPAQVGNLSASDSEGNTWNSYLPNAQSPMFFWWPNATPNPNLTVTIHGTAGGGQVHCALCDIINASTSNVVGAQAFNGGATSSGTAIQDQPDITPTSTHSLIFYMLSNGLGPTFGPVPPSPAGMFNDTVVYTGFTDSNNYSSGDGWAHLYNTSTGSQAIAWTFVNTGAQTMTSTAMEFIGTQQPVLIALISNAIAAIKARFAQPSGTVPLTGRSVLQIEAQSSTTIARSLFAKVDVSIFARALSGVKTSLAAIANAAPAKSRLVQSTGKTGLAATTAARITAQLVQSTGVTSLLARTTAQIKVLPTITAQSPLNTALTGLGKIVTTARALPRITTTLLSRANAAPAKSRAAIQNSVGLFGRSVTAVQARSATAQLIVRLVAISSDTCMGLALLVANAFMRGRTQAQTKAPPAISAASPLSRAITGTGNVVVTVRGTPSSTTTLQSHVNAAPAKSRVTTTASSTLKGRIVTMVRFAPVITSSTALLGRITAAAQTRLAAPSGTLNLFARAVTQVKSSQTLTVISPLARALTGAAKAMVTARLAQASGALALQARTAVQVKVTETLTAAAPLTAALTGVGKAVVTAAGSLIGFKFLSSRAVAQTRARAATTVQTALAAAATIVTQARLTQPIAKVALAARTAIQAQAQPLLVATQAIFGRAIVQTRSRLSSASRTIYLGAQATVAITGRLAQPTGKVLLSGFTTVAVKVKPRMQAVGNMLALSPGLATTMFRAGLSSATFRSIATRAVTSLGSFYTALTSITNTLTTLIAGSSTSGGMMVVSITQLGGPVMATGPTVTGQISIALGTTVQFSTVFNANPPGAVVNISYFQNDTLTTGSGPIPMVFQSGTTWTAQWDSGVSDGGRVDWSMHTTGGEPVLVQNGYFFLASNDATVLGL